MNFAFDAIVKIYTIKPSICRSGASLYKTLYICLNFYPHLFV